MREFKFFSFCLFSLALFSLVTSPCGLTLRKEAAFASHTSRNFSIYSRKRVKARAFGLVLMHELHVIMILLVSSINNINYHVLFFLNVLFLFSTAENWKLVSSHQMWDRKGSNVSCLSRFLAVFGPSNCCRGVDLLFCESQITVEWRCGFSLPEWHMRGNESKSCCWCCF